jgi:hypothetical protein
MTILERALDKPVPGDGRGGVQVGEECRAD